DDLDCVPASGDLLRAMRVRRGLTLKQLAAAVCKHPSTVARWEQSRIVPPDDVRPALLSALNAMPEEHDLVTYSFGILAEASWGRQASVDDVARDVEAFAARVERDDRFA